MLKEALEFLADKSEAACFPKTLHPVGEPPHTYFMYDGDGNYKRMSVEPPPRDHKAMDLDAMVTMLESERAVFWYSRKKVQCVLDDWEGRRNHVTLDLRLSEQIDWLLAMEKTAVALTQEAAVLTLRTKFRECLQAASSLIDTLRRVDFKVGSTTKTAIVHGSRNIGKSMEAELTGAAAIPEYVVFTVPIFATTFHAIHGTVECALEPLPETGQFKFIPIPGQIEKAIMAGEHKVGDLLRAKLKDRGYDCSVCYGQP